jgi:RNA polymerase sigma-70 factor, ECF subfamily
MKLQYGMLLRNSALSPWGSALAGAGASGTDVASADRAGQGPNVDAPALRASVNGNPDPLLSGWFRDHVEAIWLLVARLGVPRHSIDDIVQEVFITVSRRRADIAEGQARAFLLSTAVRLSANYRRRAHVRREVGGIELEQNASPQPNAEQLLTEKRMRELLERTLGHLSEAHRTVFVLYELEGLSGKEIAAALGLPANTVASRLARARVRFSDVAAELQRTFHPGDP